MRESILKALKNRDITFYAKSDELFLSSVDFAAGIGSAKCDINKADIEDVSYFVARAAISELWTLNSDIISIAIGTSIKHSEKKKIISGVHFLFQQLQIEPQIIFSHENYFESEFTSLAVFCTGLVGLNKLVCHEIQRGDLIYSFGSGYIRSEIKRTDSDMPDLYLIRQILKQSKCVRQVVPVGYRGIYHDITTLQKLYSLRAELIKQLDLLKGGPGLQFLVVTAEHIQFEGVTHLGKFEN